ncbi:MAG: histidine kinase, partial [Flavobacteriaceae bacterium]|nr:histidine kinase [Flavobacteriaceae bacterium]
MNPHFIFNAINGVQSIMLLKGEVESNRYIGLLSKILRFTLEINRQELISLLARQGKIDAHKEGKNWHTSKAA